MATIFEIWSPHHLASNELTFDVTPANLPMLKELSIEWVNKCLSALKVNGIADSWKIKVFRSNYYSNLPESDDWEDRWRITWTISIKVNDDEFAVSRFRLLPIPFNEHDPSWSFDDYEQIHKDRYSLLFASRNDDQRFDVFLNSVPQRLSELTATNISASSFRYSDSWREARIEFTSDTFLKNVMFYDEILHELRMERFIVNWGQLW